MQTSNSATSLSLYSPTDEENPMYVIKRDGAKEPISFDKVLERIRRAARGLTVNYTRLAQLVLAEIHDGVHTSELDELAARIAVSYMTTHPDWGTLAAQIIISNCQRSAPKRFSDAAAKLTDSLHPDVVAFIQANKEALDAMVIPANDFLLDYFGFKTLERAYLLRDPETKRVVETPQYMWLRVAIGIHYQYPDALGRIEETYNLMSAKAFTHATPTLFNAGTPRPQLSSCFLVAMKEDSIDGIFDTLKQCAQISKYAGGIGLHIHNIRAQGTAIAGTQGTSNGLVPMLRVFNNTARYVDQCFLPGTLVYTNDGPRNIEDIGVGDKVLTSTGSFETVNRPLRHEYSGPVIKLNIKHSIDSIYVTPEHNVLALTGQAKMLNHSIITNRLNKKLREVDWVDVKDLQEGDFLAFKIPSYENDIPSLTEDDCRLFGILLGDGHISEKTSGVMMNTITKADGIAFVMDYFTQRGVKLYVTEEPNVTCIRWATTATDFKFTKAQLYNAKHEKILPASMLHLPLTKTLQILCGIIETDGCVGTKEITLEMTSKPLLDQVRYLILRLGGLTSGYARNRIGNVSTYRNITTRLLSWCVRIPRLPEIMKLFPSAPPSEHFTFFRHGDMVFSRVESIEEDIYNGVVHDFEVDTTHDYTVAHMGIAHNGGGRRNGSFAIYLEPWHADIQAFLKMKSNTGSEEERARDLFYALWVPDLFMKRVEAGESWSLFCPHEAPGLADAVGPAFEALYTKYEAEGKAKRSIPAQKLWSEILVSQIETGTPYLLYKDAANLKSNQQNLGVIKSSNLCVAPETLILTDKGNFHIADLVDQEVNVWNGDAWSPTVVRKTGTRQKLIKVTVEMKSRKYEDDDYTADKHNSYKRILTCTPYHKFILPTHDKIADCERIDASQLKPGQALKCYVSQTFYTYANTWETTPFHEVTVSKVEDFGRYDDTYCFTEEQNHAGMFNGILTGQCAEIVEYSDDDETAVCNLASLALPYFVEQTLTGPIFNFDKLRAVTTVAVRNLNRVIDINFYPTPETERSNMRHRPIGLGIQGLADVFAQLGLAWETPEAATLNREIFENIYYAAMEQSHLEAIQKGPYSSFKGSPASKGILQPDLWNSPPSTSYLDWATLRTKVQRDGLRNSLVTALMPTASTSQVLGYNEAMEPFTSNIYARRTLAGEFTVVNKYLVEDLMDAGLWSPELKERIIAANGSIQGLQEVPPQIKERYKTVWEIKQKTLIDMAADRGAFICQSQSLNLFVQDPTIAKLSSMHFYAWRKGLKTGIYYLRTKSAVQAIKFTVDPTVMKQQNAQAAKEKEKEKESQECLLCSA